MEYSVLQLLQSINEIEVISSTLCQGTTRSKTAHSNTEWGQPTARTVVPKDNNNTENKEESGKVR